MVSVNLMFVTNMILEHYIAHILPGMALDYTGIQFFGNLPQYNHLSLADLYQKIATVTGLTAAGLLELIFQNVWRQKVVADLHIVPPAR